MIRSPEVANQMVDQVMRYDLPLFSRWVTWPMALEYFKPSGWKNWLVLLLSRRDGFLSSLWEL